MLGGVRGAGQVDALGEPGGLERRRSGTVHHTAVVRSVRSGRSSGSSPITSPPGWRRLRKDTTWWDDLDLAERQPAAAPGAVLALARRSRCR